MFFGVIEDTALPLPKPRLRKLLESQSPASPSSPRSLTENLTYIRAPTLPHLLSLFHHPPASLAPPNTTLLVIDSVSAPFTPYFPNPSDINQPQQAQRDVQKWLTTRKWNVISDLAAQLVKFASRANLAILVINQTHTRIRGQVRATLSPVLSGRGWESCVRARVGVYGDFGYGGDGGWVRVAEVMKRDGRLVTVRDKTTVVPFRVANVSSSLISFFDSLLDCRCVDLSTRMDCMLLKWGSKVMKRIASPYKLGRSKRRMKMCLNRKNHWKRSR